MGVTDLLLIQIDTQKLSQYIRLKHKELTGTGLWRVLATSSLLMTGVDLFQFYMPIHGHDIGISASAIGVVLAMF
jgi:hypothetical protein